MNNDQIKWGEIGYLVYKRTYAREMSKGKTEEFTDTIQRELDGIRNQLKMPMTEEEINFYWKMRMNFYGSVAGRFMWQLGTDTVSRFGMPSLQNCAFVSVNHPIRPFTWALDMLCLGSGVGFNIQRENIHQLPKVKGKIKIKRLDTKDADFIVPDTREGWVKLLGKVLKAHFYSGKGFTYSVQLIRSEGAPIKGFGGKASGPEHLCSGIESISEILNRKSGKRITSVDALDIMNIIGQIVVSGNVRRSAQIAIGDPDDIEFLKAKRWDLGGIPNWRAMSNNSVVASDVSQLAKEYWDTYLAGEAYGIVNLEAARKFGRTGDGIEDPEVEGFNPCQPGFAPILSENIGLTFMDNIKVGDKIWSSDGWVTVVNKVSNGIKPVYKFSTSGGAFIGTEDHRVVTKAGKVKAVEAKEILTLSGPDIGDFKGHDDVHVLVGLFLADGYSKTMTGRDYTYPLLITGKDDQDIRNFLSLKFNIIDPFESKGDIKVFRLPKYISDIADRSKRLSNLQIPLYYFENTKDYVKICSLLRGLYSGNGSVISSKGVPSRIAYKSVSKVLIEQMQILLSILGIRSYVTINGPKTIQFPNGEYTCAVSYDLNITKDADVFMKHIGFIQDYKNSKGYELKSVFKDKNTFGNVKSKEFIGDYEVFDITVDGDSHTYWTGGVSVSNCGEQPLANFETCCLAEIYLPNIPDYPTMLKTCEMLYKVNKHSLMLNSPHEETTKIVHKNMRMGIGVTGVLMCSEKQLKWLSDAYSYLREFDKEYSKKIGANPSIRLTTIKPSGTLSLLPGVTPGIHPSPAGPYYIRRVTIASNSELVNVCRSHGYPVEFKRNFDGSNDRTSMVVSFPCKIDRDVPVADTYSWKEQLDVVRFMQRNWSDNSVSCSVYYTIGELPEIKNYLEQYLPEIKSVSFMLKSGHGFDQAPYETISAEQYYEMVSKTTPITSIEIKETDFAVDECEGGACPIK